ncbi:MAG: type II toxin-antitoxin system RelE/ParE family toxin [Xanthomonadaceae bacterium]|nr:type II toxin-antitoxin system RelE/ParE family toxin [Xanthomonadaceae bacterium]
MDDLDGIAEHYAAQEAWEAAIDVPDRIRAAAPLIGHQPEGWSVGLSGHRERVLSDLPFRIAYDVTVTEVIILRIKHTKQQWP